ncbi:hypothetical protein AX769_20780 (plasmid) [Frondihabitans sp. PAMC 28766]|uniref:glycoside hydrolase family 2 protein n=1 Tax=Frondihabitans sp. PAMC 28766 TaxID=1795630 RepID=UPI00078BA757|nr:glycoside hydrolase family 2 [Frondihabitans sp. PAMC 28766]AMM22584.1 hypothetical protein AX769_20780 [Frondihabitans sp. PAMC 28766]
MAADLADPALDDSGYEEVTLPHAVAPLSWRQWDPATWEHVWSYRRHFDAPVAPADRSFVDFEAVNVAATVTLNGHRLGRHFGGYLPFSFEVTEHLRAGDNVLAVLVDARFNLNVPPNLPAPARSEDIDFWQPGGIHGTVTLRAVPGTFVSDVSAVPRDVLDPDRRRVEITAFVDARDHVDSRILTELVGPDGATVASADVTATLSPGVNEVPLSINDVGSVALWDVESPTLYRAITSVCPDGGEPHAHRTRIGFREARFERDGFFLNGRRLYLFGANRHQHFPFAGFAMPSRVQRKDAELLRDTLNCVMVRCSHYPQSSAFLDACDELGLLVWEEPPGWQYVGDAEWRQRAKDDIAAMIVRDRNRPSVIVWAARLNETYDHPDFYAETEALVRSLDDSRATSGTTHGQYHDTPDYQHEVFAYDDYSIHDLPNGDHCPTLLPPRDDFPYLIGETVTSWSSPTRLYRRAQRPEVQQHQAMDYAHVHNKARSDARYSGVLAWSAIDYHAGHVVNHRGVKTSGLLDTFRVPKPGAAMYRAQVDPSRRVVLEPAFTWDPPVDGQTRPGLDNRTPEADWGPGENAVVFSNCDRLEVTLGGRHHATVFPDTTAFPHLVTAPSFVDLRLPHRNTADLVLDGYIGARLAISRRFSGRRDHDVLSVVADDARITADAVDTTRVELSIRDEFGEARGRSEARITLEVDGPGVLVGEPFFDFAETGAVGAVWIRSRGYNESGLVTLRASHQHFGSVALQINAVAP